MELAWTNQYGDDLGVLEERATPALPGVRLGRLVAIDPPDGVWVTLANRPSDAPLSARSTVSISPEDKGRSLLLIFEENDPQRPIIVGFIQEQPVVVPDRAEPATPEPPATVSLRGPKVHDVKVDGKHICLEAEKEVMLRCGKSSIRLCADGEIVIKGMKIVSRARGLNKVKGKAVLIN